MEADAKNAIEPLYREHIAGTKREDPSDSEEKLDDICNVSQRLLLEKEEFKFTFKAKMKFIIYKLILWLKEIGNTTNFKTTEIPSVLKYQMHCWGQNAPIEVLVVMEPVQPRLSQDLKVDRIYVCPTRESCHKGIIVLDEINRYT